MLADLKRAVKSRKISSVNLILKKNPNLKTKEAGNILWHAVLDDEIEIASTLVDAGVDLDVRKPNSPLEETFLHVLGSSVDPRHRCLALQMLDHGADVDARDKRANSVLSRVLEAKHSDVDFIAELLLRGARVDLNELCKTSEHPLAAELLPLVLEVGIVDVETRRERAEHALYFVCGVDGSDEDRTLAATESVFGMGLSLRKSYIFVVGALVRAVDSDKREVVRFLLDRGVNVNEKLFCHATPLHSACKNASLEMIELLLHRGADFNVVDDLGDTPFSSISDIGELMMSDKCRLGIKHLAILTVEGRDMHERDRTIIEESTEMKKFYDQCLGELRMMRLMNFFNGTTYFDVLTSDVKQLSFSIRNRNFVESFEGHPRDEKFPIFCKELGEVFGIAVSRREQLLEKEVALREELVDVLPYVPLEMIVFCMYMSEEVDVKN